MDVICNFRYKLVLCDYSCEFVNLKCKLMLVNHDKSHCRRKCCDVNRNP